MGNNVSTTPLLVLGVVFGLIFFYIALLLFGPVVKKILDRFFDFFLPVSDGPSRFPAKPYDEGAVFDGGGYAAQVTKINSGDFRGVRERLMSIYEWDLGRVELAEREYRRFVLLSLKNRSLTVVPWDLDLDLFWQEHIVDTRAYQEFCERVLGFFLHRNAALTSDSPSWAEGIAATKNLYRREFGYAVWAGDPPLVSDDKAAGEFFANEEPVPAMSPEDVRQELSKLARLKGPEESSLNKQGG